MIVDRVVSAFAFDYAMLYFACVPKCTPDPLSILHQHWDRSDHAGVERIMYIRMCKHIHVHLDKPMGSVKCFDTRGFTKSM